jgi:prevent-host-death family protein
MKEVRTFEAKNRLGTLLDWVGRGEDVVITRRGKAVARMIASRPLADRGEARAAVVASGRSRRGAARGGLKIKDLMSEGRL